MLSFSFDPTASLGENDAALRRRKMLIFGGAGMVFIVLVIIGVVVAATSGNSTTVTVITDNPNGTKSGYLTPQDNPTTVQASIGGNTPASIHTVKPLSGTVSVQDLPFMTRMSVWVKGHVPLVVGILVAVLVLVGVAVAVGVLFSGQEQPTGIFPTPPEPTPDPLSPEEEQSPWGVVGIVVGVLAFVVVVVVTWNWFGPRKELVVVPPDGYQDFRTRYDTVLEPAIELCKPQKTDGFPAEISVRYTLGGDQYEEYVYCKVTLSFASIHKALSMKPGFNHRPFYVAPREDSEDSRDFVLHYIDNLEYSPSVSTKYYDELMDKLKDYLKMVTIITSEREYKKEYLL